MHTRVLGLVLLTGCYWPGAERHADHVNEPEACVPEPEPEREPERDEDTSAQPIQTRRVEPDVSKETDTPTVGITISLPTHNVDCGDVLLAVVGARPALLGERVVLTASWSGPVSDDEADDRQPTLLWADKDMMTNLTVTGPATAEVLCDRLGVHEIRVELAPPAPCPATLQVEIECVEN